MFAFVGRMCWSFTPATYMMHFHHSFDKLIPSETQASFFSPTTSLHRQLMLNVFPQVSFSCKLSAGCPMRSLKCIPFLHSNAPLML